MRQRWREAFAGIIMERVFVLGAYRYGYLFKLCLVRVGTLFNDPFFDEIMLKVDCWLCCIVLGICLVDQQRK